MATVALTLRADADVALDGDDVVVRGVCPPAVLRFKQTTPALRSALQRLAGGAATEDELRAEVAMQDDLVSLYKLGVYLARLHAAALLRRTLLVNGEPFSTLEPMSLRCRWREPIAGAVVRLSAFACIRRDGDAMLVESPQAPARVVLHDPQAAAALAMLATPRAATDLASALPASCRGAIPVFLDMLATAGALEDETAAPADARALAQWEFHDLLFHARCRLGRHNAPYGGHFPFIDIIDPLPAIKPAMSQATVPLVRPDLDAVAGRDLPLTRAIETRRSVREFGGTPLSLDELGEFLFRVGRVTSVSSGKFGESIHKPYPAGGALYELEMYPVVDRCRGLDAGLYHYAPDRHVLEPIASRSPEVDGLLDDAWAASERHSRPHVLLVIAARFQRVQWKYRSVSYALVLKHVGVLYQTMYLVATSMGLGGCALGGGDADRFAGAAGLNYFEESSVGEFMLGTCP